MEKIFSKLTVKAFHVSGVTLAEENTLNTGGGMTVCPRFDFESEYIEKITVTVSSPEDRDMRINSVLDVIPISAKVLGKMGSGITHTLTGVCVMLTGCDSDGVQCAEFGSSEGILREKVTFGAPSAPEKDDYIIIFDVLFKSGIMSSRKAIYEAHMLCDRFIQPFREILRGFKGELCTERHDYTDSIKDGRKNIVLLKQVAAQGAMYDTYVFPKEPSGALGGMSVIDLGSMPIVLTANEYRDGALRSMQ